MNAPFFRTSRLSRATGGALIPGGAAQGLFYIPMLYVEDLVAVLGNPLTDMSALLKRHFDMKCGRVYMQE